MTTTAPEVRPARDTQIYVPPPPEALYEPPRGAIDPDESKGWIRRIFPVAWAHKRSFAFTMGTAAIALSLNVAIPAVAGRGIDEVRTGGANLHRIVWILAIFTIVRGIFTYGYRAGVEKTAFAIEYDLRSLIFRHLTRMSHGFYDKVQTGQLVSRANSDIKAVQALMTFGPFLLMASFTFTASVVFMFTVHVGLTLVALSTLPVVYMSGVRLRSIMFPISWVIQGRTAEVATIVEENVTGVRVVKGFAGERSQINSLAGAARRLRWAAIKGVNTQAIYGPLMANLPRLAMALTLLYGGGLAIDGAVTVGQIVTFTTYVLMLQAPFRMFGQIMMMGQRAAASAARIMEIWDTPAEIDDRDDAVDLVDPAGEVRFEQVRFSYDDEMGDVLNGLDLTIAPGETIAVVGATGSGKSTIASLLLRFYEVDDGAIRIDGHDVRDLSLTSLHHHVGMVTDEPFLFSDSIRDNIAYARPDASLEGVEAAARAASAAGFIEELPNGWDTIVGERGFTLSGGQRQRVAIARTVLADPAILILDDATSAVDVRVEAEIHKALEELSADRTTIVVAHRLSTIALADRVVLIEGGRVLASGTHAELMAGEPRYAEVLASAPDADEQPLDDLEAVAAVGGTD